MSDFDLAATVAYVDANAQAKGNYGCVYELWQQARNAEAYALLGHVPDEHFDATVEALKDKGVIVEIETPEDGLCKHWLDANTCPCGCFEGEEPAPVIEDNGDRLDPNDDDLDAPEEPDEYLDTLPDVEDD